MAVPIAELFVSVSSDVSQAISGLEILANSMNSTVAGGLALAGVGVAIAAGLGEVVSQAAGFNAMMIQMQNNSTLTSDNLSQMSQNILNLAGASPASLTDLADGFRQIADHGFDAQQSTEILTVAMESATATGANVNDTARTLAQTLDTFGLSADDASTAMDMLHTAANQGNLTMEQLTTSFGQVAAWAGNLGVPLDQVVSAFAAMTRNGFDAATAGTQVKDLLEHIIKPSEGATKALNQLSAASGIDLTGALSATGLEMRGLTGTLDLITSAMNAAGMSASDQTGEWLKLIPNIRGGAAAFVLTGQGADDFRQILDAVDHSQGSVAAAFERMSQTPQFQWGVLTNQLQVLAITLGQELQPQLSAVIGVLQEVVKWFQNLDPSIQVAILDAAAITSAILILAGGFVLLAPVLTAAGAALDVVEVALAPIAGPLLVIAAAAAVLYAAWQDDFGGIREVTQQVWDAIQPAFTNWYNFIIQIQDALAPMFSSAQSAAGPFIEQMSGALAPILAQLPGAVKALGDELNRLGTFFGIVADSVKFLVGGDMDAFIRLLENTDAPIGFVQALAQLHSAFEAIGPVVEEVSQAINFLITGNIDKLVELMQEGLPQEFASALQFIHDVLAVQVQVWKDVIGGIVEFVGYLNSGDLQGAWNSILNTVGKLRDDILPLWNEFLTVLGNLLAALGPWIGGKVSDLWNDFLVEWQTLPAKATLYWDAIKASLSELVKQLPGALGAAANGLWQYVLGVFSTLPGEAVLYWDAIKASLSGLMTQLPGTLGVAAGNMWDYVLGLFSALPGLAQAKWGEILSNLSGLMTQLPGTLGVAAGNMWDYVLGLFSALPGLAQEKWNDILSNLGGLMQELPGVLASAAGNMWDYFLGLFSALPGLAQEKWNDILDNLGGLMQQLPGVLATAGGDIWAGIVEKFSGLIELLRPYWEQFTEWLGGLIQGIPQFIADNLGDIFGGIVDQAGALKDRIAEAIDPIRELLKNTFGNIWSWITNGTPGSGSGSGGGSGGGSDTGTGTSSVVVNIGNIYISNEEELQNFLDAMAAAILSSANRVTVPTGGTNPALA